MYLVKNLNYLIGDRKVTDFCARLSESCGKRIPATTVQGWLSSKSGEVRAMRHLKALADHLSRERGRKITVDDLMFTDLEAEDQKARRNERSVTILDALMGGEELRGTFQITIKKVSEN